MVPSEWKLVNVVPIHKKGAKENVENYRPISLTSLVMKTFEGDSPQILPVTYATVVLPLIQ